MTQMLDRHATIHLIGICGTGMGALAGLLVAKGYRVTGSDLRASRATERLAERGARVAVGHRVENIAGADVVVTSTAVDREKPQRRGFRNTPDGRARLLGYLRERAKAAGAKRIAIVYEASALGFGLYDELTEAGLECHVLAPTRLPATPKRKRNKTDERDATMLLEVLRAHVLAGNALPSVRVPDAQARDDRELVRARLDAQEKASRVKTQIRSHLKRHGLRPPEDVGKAWTQGWREWLAATVLPSLEFGAGLALGPLLGPLAYLEHEVGGLDAGLAQLAKEPRYAESVKALCEVTGIARLGALVFLTEMGDPRRFRNRRQVGAYVGLAPSSFESGEQDDRKGRITRQGPARVRKVLCQAVWVAVRYDKELAATRDRIARGRKRGKKIATVALMRRLAIRLWRIALEHAPPETPRAA